MSLLFIVSIYCISVRDKETQTCMKGKASPLPLCINGQTHTRFVHKSILLYCTLPSFFFFLCGYFGNSFLKGREKQSVFFNPVMWKQWREPRLRKNSTAVLQFVCLLLNREGLLSLLTSYISLSIHVSVAVWALGCPHRGATAWVKVNPNYLINTNSICLPSHTCTSMPSTE